MASKSTSSRNAKNLALSSIGETKMQFQSPDKLSSMVDPHALRYALEKCQPTDFTQTCRATRERRSRLNKGSMTLLPLKRDSELVPTDYTTPKSSNSLMTPISRKSFGAFSFHKSKTGEQLFDVSQDGSSPAMKEDKIKDPNISAYDISLSSVQLTKLSSNLKSLCDNL